MRAKEFILPERKRKRKKVRWAAYGPGPYGGYGFYPGYSGDGGSSEGGGGESIEPDEPGYQHSKLTMPANTLVIDTPGELDWYKIGQHFPTLGGEDPHEFGQSESDMVVTFADREEMIRFAAKAKKLGLKIKNIGGTPEHPEIHRENFADGKVKGKSRPGRVKRSGASCNGSVTDLRKKAKNASGERAKMYHWCANMKSGRGK